jgi:NAD(P)-dependent dehydrogenase (short-subunit alcohol dehydrogenase family)
MPALAGKRVLVVGASSGIGRAVACAAVKGGADVVFSARRRDALEAAVAEAGGGTPVVIDVRDQTSVASGVAEAVAVLGGLDVLVYTTGMSPLAMLVDVDASTWAAVLETNVVGAALVAREAVAHLAGHGIAMFTSSIDPRRVRTGIVPYAVSKAALDTLVDGLRLEHEDVRFVDLVVGPTMPTGFGDGFDPALAGALFGPWIAGGWMTRALMDTSDLGAVIVELMATGLAHPGVDLRRVNLEPPGGVMALPVTPEALAQAMEPATFTTS